MIHAHPLNLARLRPHANALALLLSLGFATLHAAEKRTVAFADDFENRTELGDGYNANKKWPNAWKVQDGILVSRQENPDHGSVINREFPFHNAEIEFDFRFNGGKRFNVVINDKADKTVWAGHVCRVSITPKSITIGDDKTGSMNLEVRDLRKDTNLSAEKKQALDDLLARTQAAADVDLKQGSWYRMRVRIVDDTMEVDLDGKTIAALTSPGFNQPKKTHFGFTATGTTIDFDNLKVRALPD